MFVVLKQKWKWYVCVCVCVCFFCDFLIYALAHERFHDLDLEKILDLRWDIYRHTPSHTHTHICPPYFDKSKTRFILQFCFWKCLKVSIKYRLFFCTLWQHTKNEAKTWHLTGRNMEQLAWNIPRRNNTSP